MCFVVQNASRIFEATTKGLVTVEWKDSEESDEDDPSLLSLI